MCPTRGCRRCPVRHLHVRGRPSDCEEEECPSRKKKRGNDHCVVDVELETFNNEGVDQSTESVDNSFASFSEAGVGVDEEASVDVSIDEESNKR